MKKLILVAEPDNLFPNMLEQAIRAGLEIAEAAFGGTELSQLGLIFLPNENGAPGIGKQSRVAICGSLD